MLGKSLTENFVFCAVITPTITTAQFYSTLPEARFCSGSNLARSMSVVYFLFTLFEFDFTGALEYIFLV